MIKSVRSGGPVGDTVEYVVGQGFVRLGRCDLLVSSEGTRRAVAELVADYADPRVLPQDAIRHIVGSMKTGWMVRFTQVYWPDAALREAMISHVMNHMSPGSGNEVRAILYEGLLGSLDPGEIPLTFERRTFMEFAITNKETLYWWETLGATLQRDYRIQMIYLDAAAVTNLAKSILNPLLDTKG